MEQYKVELSNRAKNDYIEIINYIKYKLEEPSIAKKYAIIIKEEIKKLEQFPQKFPVIDLETMNNKEIRKLVIKNYIVFYQINEKKRIVNILRILYGGTNWINKL